MAHIEDMFTLYRVVRRSIAQTDPAQCEQEQKLRYVAGITSFENGAKQFCSGAEIIPTVVLLVRTEALSRTVSAMLLFTILYIVNIA